MRPGLDADDGWRMVEDELLATAHAFTAHLHAAEYRRLKAKLLLGGRRRGFDIDRPTVPVPGLTGDGDGNGGLLPADLRAKRGRASRERSQARAVAAVLKREGVERDAKGKGKGKAKTKAKVEDGVDAGRADEGEDGDEDETPWAGTSLFGLMEGADGLDKSPVRRQAPSSLSKIASSIGSGNGSTTRAAAGYTRASGGLSARSERPVAPSASHVTGSPAVHEDGDDEADDDLDGPPAGSRFPAKGKEATTWPLASRPAAPPDETVVRRTDAASGSSFREPQGSKPSQSPSIWIAEDSDDGDDLFNMLRSSKRVKTDPTTSASGQQHRGSAVK